MKKKKKGATRVERVIEYITVPKHWSADPLKHAMKTAVRPPTKLTRRKQIVIELKVPPQIFFDIMRPFETGELTGLEWVDPEKSALKPTNEKPTYHEYKYTVSKPAQNDKLWRLQDGEIAPRRQKKKDGSAVAFRRGKGCSRLHLSAAAEERGARTDLLAQVTGNVILTLKVAKKERVMPTLKIAVAISTMNHSGDIIWAKKYEDRTAAALRKQMRQHLQEMIADPEYPTLQQMTPALTMGGDAVRAEPPPRPVAGLLH